jgi:hypothetical protein
MSYQSAQFGRAWEIPLPPVVRPLHAVADCVDSFTPGYCQFVTLGLQVHVIADIGLNMRWFKGSIRSSIYGLLGNPAGPTESVMETGTEDIREAMLALLEQAGPKQFPHVTRRVRYANDIQALWYLRGDLMAALAAGQGEVAARQKVQKITEMFHGLLPGSLASRPSPLT